jgi:hypothetical protein
MIFAPWLIGTDAESTRAIVPTAQHPWVILGQWLESTGCYVENPDHFIHHVALEIVKTSMGSSPSFLFSHALCDSWVGSEGWALLDDRIFFGLAYGVP